MTVLQNLILPFHNAKSVLAKETYFVYEAGEGEYSFDTIGNSFPESFYTAYTNVRKIRLILAGLPADTKVSVYRKAAGGQSRLVSESFAVSEAGIDFDIELVPGQSRLYYKIKLEELPQELSVSWVCHDHKLFNASIALGITTFNKRSYLLENLEKLAEYKFMEMPFSEIIVVDNGDQRVGDFLGSDLKLPLTLIEQSNLGGTGGFERTAQEAVRHARTHIVFMDDDIVFHPDMLTRIFGFVSHAEREFILGGMCLFLNSDRPVIKEQGANVDKDHLFGLKLFNSGIDLKGDKEHMDRLTQTRETHYSGWWLNVAGLDGKEWVPPYFIKRDDISFGLASYNAGKPTIVPPNIFVWHSEIGSPAYYYYDIRNDLVMRSRLGFEASISAKQVLRNGIARFVRGDYRGLRVYVRSFDDFIKGPEHNFRDKDRVESTRDWVFKNMKRKVSFPEGELEPAPRASMLLSAVTLFGLLNPATYMRGPQALESNPRILQQWNLGSYLVQCEDDPSKAVEHIKSPKSLIELGKLVKLVAAYKLKRSSIVEAYKTMPFDRQYWENFFGD